MSVIKSQENYIDIGGSDVGELGRSISRNSIFTPTPSYHYNIILYIYLFLESLVNFLIKE
jgi:hypothetical protein